MARNQSGRLAPLSEARFFFFNIAALALLIPAALFIGGADSVLVSEIRAPRVITALLAGFAIAVASLVTQAIFSNPIVEPTFLGVSSGAALGAVVAVLLGIGGIGEPIILISAVAGALLTATLILNLTKSRSALVLILTGIAVTAIVNALVGGAITLLDRSDIRSFSFWTLGSLALADWPAAITLAISLLFALPIALIIAKKLDLLTLGELSLKHLGVNITQLRVVSFFVISLLVAATVSSIGSIAFLGLASVHITRSLIGPSHKPLLFLAGLFSANILITADLIARRAFFPQELPIGFVIAILAAPVLIIALRNQRVWSER
jgi:iron complex transport system permease protein